MKRTRISRSAALLLVGALFMLSLTTVRGQSANLLTNPGFEPPFATVGGTPPRQVAQGWLPWHLSGGASSAENAQPEYYPSSDVDNGLGVPRIHSGTDAQQYFTFFATHTGGVYQIVSGVTPGSQLTFSVWAYLWSTALDDPDSSERDGGLVLQVGIDPAAGSNPESASIIWSDAAQTYDAYAQYSVTAAAAGTSVSVWVRSRATFPVKNNVVYLDDASLSVGGGEVPPTDVPPTDVPPTATNIPTLPPTPTNTLIPPTVEPPTATTEPTLTPTEIPPTDVPPTATTEPTLTPTEIPPTDVPPTATTEPTLTPTEVPPTEVPPTDVPPTATTEPTLIPTEIPPTDVPPTEVPPTATLIPTEVPPSATPIPSDTPLPSNTPIPSATPLPTNTPPPSSTPLPTNTPLPPTPMPTIDRTQYPSLIVHTVVAGDSIYRLAQQYRTTMEAIFIVNGLNASSIIYIGQQLVIPVGSVPATSVPSSTPIPSATPFPTIPPQPTVVPGETIVYIVQYGDTLGQIAYRYGSTIFDIARLNNILNINLIFVGQALLVPVGSAFVPAPTPVPTAQPTATPVPIVGSYTVQRGDTLYRLSIVYKVPVNALAQVNGIPNPNRIYPGQVLVIPAPSVG